MLTTVELTLDCADAPALAEFWKLAAGYIHHPPPYTTMQEWQAHQARPQTSPKGVWWALRSFAPLLHAPPGATEESKPPRSTGSAARRGGAWRTRPGR
jgi:RimJ/RimL family protein N-acetyltransferase